MCVCVCRFVLVWPSRKGSANELLNFLSLALPTFGAAIKMRNGEPAEQTRAAVIPARRETKKKKDEF